MAEIATWTSIQTCLVAPRNSGSSRATRPSAACQTRMPVAADTAQAATIARATIALT